MFISCYTTSVMSGKNTHKIEEIRRRLEVQENLIQELTATLELAQRKYDTLKDELATYEEPTQINNFPPEILSIIFGYFIRENPMDIVSLLLIRKGWYHMIMDDLLIWSTIVLVVPDDCWDLMHWVKGAKAFVTKCIELSRSSPLEIYLDFERLQTTKEQLIDRMIWGFSNLPETADSPPHHSLISYWLDKVDCDELVRSFPAAKVCCPENIISLLDHLTPSIQRWRAYHIVFPDDPVLAPMIHESEFIDPFPNLYSLSIIGPRSVGDSFESTALPFPTVKHLSINTSGDSRAIHAAPSSLDSLSIIAIADTEFIRQLSRLGQLRKLTLNASALHYTQEPTRHVFDVLSLPLLEELTLNDGFRPVNNVEFRLPCLRLLILDWPWKWTADQTIPEIQPHKVCWTAKWSSHRWSRRNAPKSPDDIQLAKVSLKALLLHFTGSQDLMIPYYMKEALVGLIRELASDQRLPTTWKKMSFYNGHESLQVSKIITSTDLDL